MATTFDAILKIATQVVGAENLAKLSSGIRGVEQVAKWLLGEDCGCEERKEKLNKLFPYKKPKCLTEDEYNFLITFYDERSSRLKPTEQASILRIYNRVFGIRQEPTRCADCWRRILTELEKVIQTYEQDEQQEQPVEA